MKKYLIGLTAILAVCSTIWAIEIGKYNAIEYMVVEANSGVTDSFPTSDVDSFYFSNANTVLKIDKSNKTSKTYDVSTFSNIHFCTDSVYGDEPDSHKYVDLGLSSGTLWATVNIGARNEYDPGSFFMWGKTEPYSEDQESWGGYKDKKLLEEGVISSGILTAKYDAANVLWGEHWRLPTLEEVEELFYLNSVWVERNGVEGREFKGKNGKTLFIPANDQKAADKELAIWSSTVHKFYINEGSGSAGGHSTVYGVGTDDMERRAALAIRPVRISCPIALAHKELFFDKIDTTISLGFYSIPSDRVKSSDIIWTSSDESIATVKNGLVTSVSDGFCVITGRYKNYRIKCNVQVGDNINHDYVDLGLPSGTLWATTNIGTTLADGFGQYFVWGATEENEKFKWDKMMTNTLMEKGVVDDKSRLNPKYDVATVQWGEDWKMPSPDEFEELWNVCKKEWRRVNGVNGVVFVGPSGKSMFMPAAGYKSTNIGTDGYYWSSVTYGYNTAYTDSKNLRFGLDYYGVELTGDMSSLRVGNACPVRPVRKIIPDTVTFSIAEDEIELATTDAPLKLTYSCVPADVLSRLDVMWSSSDETVATGDYGFVRPVGEGECVISGDYKNLHVECKVKVTATKVSIKDTIRMKLNGLDGDLGFTCYPAGKIKISDFKWKVSDESVAKMMYYNQLLAVSKDTCVLTGVYKDFNVSSVVIVEDQQINDTIDGVEYVDLGLPSGTLWAVSNVGAKSATGEGTYFKWGDVTPNANSNSSGNSKEYLRDNGIIDSADVLSVAFDVATRYIGAGHKMPTKAQMEELIENCTVSYAYMNNNSGCCFVSKNNGKELFLPATGYMYMSAARSTADCFYWTSSLPSGDTKTAYCYHAPYLETGGLDTLINTYSHPIRSVVEPKNIKPITISIDTTPLQVYTHETAIPAGFTSSANDLISEYNVEWSSSDSSVAVVTAGKVDPIGVGECVITGEYKGQKVSRKVVVSMKGFTLPQGNYVDLGLPSGTLWATHNLGAKTQTEIGDYYSWGEIEPKESFSKTSLWSEMNMSELKSQGVIDENNVLTSDNDAATALLGMNWKIPTYQQYKELISSCTSRVVEVEGVRGILFESDNGNCLFFPGKEEEAKGSYWTASMSSDYSVYSYYFSIDNFKVKYMWVSDSRVYNGYNIRPVYIK